MAQYRRLFIVRASPLSVSLCIFSLQGLHERQVHQRRLLLQRRTQEPLCMYVCVGGTRG